MQGLRINSARVKIDKSDSYLRISREILNLVDFSYDYIQSVKLFLVPSVKDYVETNEEKIPIQNVKVIVNDNIIPISEVTSYRLNNVKSSEIFKVTNKEASSVSCLLLSSKQKNGIKSLVPANNRVPFDIYIKLMSVEGAKNLIGFHIFPLVSSINLTKSSIGTQTVMRIADKELKPIFIDCEMFTEPIRIKEMLLTEQQVIVFEGNVKKNDKFVNFNDNKLTDQKIVAVRQEESSTLPTWLVILIAIFVIAFIVGILQGRKKALYGRR